MKPADRSLLFRGVLAVGLCVFGPGTLPAQDEEPPEDDEDTVTVEPLKTEIFRSALDQKGIKPIASSGDIRTDPRNSIIILLGEKSISNYTGWELRQAVEQGASLLIASDRSSARTSLGQLFGVEIEGAAVDADPEDCFRQKEFFPFVRPKHWLQVEPGSPRALFQSLDPSGTNALATNDPSFLRIRPNFFPRPEVLAGYPFSAKIPGRGNLDPDQDFFAAGGPLGEGRYLVLADHSVFINSMIWRPELNANLFFARDCIDWLQGPEKKTRCLFIEDGVIQTQFELKVPEKPIPWLKKLLLAKLIIERAGNQVVGEFQQKDVFNRFLNENVGHRTILRFVLLVVTVLAAFFGLFLMLRNRTRPDPARTLVTPELAAMIPRGNVLRQRFEAQLDTDNVYEAARQMVRDFLAGLDAEPDANGLPPRLAVEDGYLDEAGLRRRIMRLWRIGYDSVPLKLPPGDWKELTKDLQDVLTDADEGWWKFVPAATPLERA
jgi:hypothetical protein